MKRNIYLLTLIAIFGWSCSKNPETLPDLAKYDVTFVVTGFESFTEKIPSKQQSLSAVQNPSEIKGYLELFIYDAWGKLATKKMARCCGSSAGVLVEGLSLGSYTVVAVAHNSMDGMKGSGIDLISTAKIELGSHDPSYGEIFMQKTEFEVKNLKGNEVGIVLERKVALLTVDITDTPPADVAYVRATVPHMAKYYNFDFFMPTDYEHSPSITHRYDRRADKFNLFFFVPYNGDEYVTPILLQVIGTDGQVLRERTINYVSVGTNVRTTIRGKLFQPDDSGFSVDIDTAWNGGRTIDF